MSWYTYAFQYAYLNFNIQVAEINFKPMYSITFEFLVFISIWVNDSFRISKWRYHFTLMWYLFLFTLSILAVFFICFLWGWYFHLQKRSEIKDITEEKNRKKIQKSTKRSTVIDRSISDILLQKYFLILKCKSRNSLESCH